MISDYTFLVRNSNGDSYSVYFDIENKIFDMDNASSFLSELDIFFFSFFNNNSGNFYYYYSMDDTQSNRNNPIYSFIETYLRFEIEICLNSDIYSGIENYITNFFCAESISSIEGENLSIEEGENLSIEEDENLSIEEGENLSIEEDENLSIEEDENLSIEEDENLSIEEDENLSIEEDENLSIETSSSSFNRIEISNNFDRNTNNFDRNTKLWVQCDNCYETNYKKFFRSKMNICEHCGYHLNMSSSDRIELFIDPGTWEPMDKDMVSMDPIEIHSEEEPYRDRIYFYQRKTGLTDAVQTGIGQLNSIPIAIGIMDFQFMGGSMGSVVGEKITRLIEYATNRSLPVIIVCASGGARMQEGSLSLMQMAKISSASYDYQSKKKLFYVSILTSPTTGGVTASFGMLGDIIIAEPNAHIAFAGKRVIEQTLKKTVPDGSQAAEYSFHKGLFDPIVPRNPLKGVLNELFQLHGFLPLNQG
uniref:Acetyl-coenzyme A carboxylase carboxyl transferase subunit beta n=1 Tax=Habenaria cruciformis TaxID=1715882 RepID=A0A8A1RXQ6_9ASPA|nr:acetyl-CoA carboxylase carboxyl transferase beta [Habenaria cruciformis]QST19951.1 acetyl-CoA carboxylase carboxyl transferase beta [Habenaria cruciformis]